MFTRIRKLITNEILLLISSLIAFALLQNLSGLPILSSKKYILLNIIVLYSIYKLVFLLINRIWISCLLCNIIFYLFGIANYFTNQFRGVMILPWDFLSLGTAADVAGGYEYKLYPAMLFWLLYIIISATILKIAKLSFPKGKNRIPYSALSAVLLFFLVFGMTKTSLYKSIPDRLYLIERYYKSQGIPVSFFNYSKFLFTKKPDGYSVDLCKESLDNYIPESTDGIIPQNVIVIMNESFANFAKLGSLPEIDNSLDFIDSLDENVIKGNLYVPVYGGTTVNSEYEFLTGNSIVFEKGCPFSYAVREDRPSIARVFDELGYEIHSMHPAAPENWNRKSVYPYLGMHDFVSLNDLAGLNLATVNEHITDSANYAQLIKMYENKASEKFFAFNVTMQNHSGYSFDFEEETGKAPVDLSQYGDMTSAENYLSLLAMSDDAFEELINYFSQVDEPTIICMFGDHQPKIEDEFYELLSSGADFSDPKENLKKYSTPFIIWSNYEIDSEYYDGISSNYLSELLLEKCNIALPYYYDVLKRTRALYPVFSVNGVYDNDGNFYKPEDIPLNTINEYKFFEFNNAKEKRDSIIWDAYLP